MALCDVSTFSSVLAVDNVRARREVLNGLLYLADGAHVAKTGSIFPDLSLLADKGDDLSDSDFDKLVTITHKIVQSGSVELTLEVATTAAKLLKFSTSEEHHLLCLDILKECAQIPSTLASREIINETMALTSRTIAEEVDNLALEVMLQAVSNSQVAQVCIDLNDLFLLFLRGNFASTTYQLPTAKILNKLVTKHTEKRSLFLNSLKFDELIDELLELNPSDPQVQRLLFDASTLLEIEKKKISRQASSLVDIQPIVPIA